MASTWATIDVDGSPMESYLALPAGDGPFPGGGVAMHAYGVDAGVRKFCDDLALEGFAAIAPYFYHRNRDMSVHEFSSIPFHNPRRQEEAAVRRSITTLETLCRDSLAALVCLRALPQVGGSPVGITGFCLGGRVSLYMAGASDEFAASAIRCPLAGFFGSEDQNPSPADVDEVEP